MPEQQIIVPPLWLPGRRLLPLYPPIRRLDRDLWRRLWREHSLQAAAAFDATSNSGVIDGFTSSATFSHTCSGSDRVLVVGVSFNTGASTAISSITYAGSGLTVIRNDAGGSTRSTLWGLIAPATGANNVVVTLAANPGGRWSAGAMSFTGAHQTTPFANHNGAVDEVGVSAISATVTSEVDAICADVFALWDGDPPSQTPDAGQTARWSLNQDAGQGFGGAGSTKPGAASVTMGWTCPANSSAAISVVSVAPAPADALPRRRDYGTRYVPRRAIYA